MTAASKDMLLRCGLSAACYSSSAEATDTASVTTHVNHKLWLDTVCVHKGKLHVWTETVRKN